MKRGRRRVLFWIIAGLLIGLFAGSILLLRSIALPHRYRGLIESRLRAVTDRDVQIRGASLRFLGGLSGRGQGGSGYCRGGAALEELASGLLLGCHSHRDLRGEGSSCWAGDSRYR